MLKFIKNNNSKNDKKLLLDAWKEVVDVQMHFNDMEMKIRSMAVTVIAAIAGAIGYLCKEGVNHQEEFIVLLAFVGAAAWLCFYLMDRFMYHRLLVGAVKSGINIENKLKEQGVEIDLGAQIKIASPLTDLFGEKLEMHSDQKLDFFYITVPLICINAILAFLKLGLPATLLVIVTLSYWGLYALAKGYETCKKERKYNWSPYLIFLVLNILFIFLFLNISNLSFCLWF